MSDNGVSVISHDEQLGMGLGTVVHAGEIIDPDSAVVMAEMAAQNSGMPQYDKENRPIISYRQYLDLCESNGDMSRFALRMFHPRKPNAAYPVQASKLQKWWGLGYRPW